MDFHYILGIHAKNRVLQAGKVQEFLTEYGCSIRTRIGLHHVATDQCAADGVILLELFGDEATCRELQSKLESVAGVEVKTMIFEH